MSQYIVYGDPYHGGYYYPYDKQTSYYSYGQPNYITGHAQKYILTKKKNPYDINQSRSTSQSSYMQEHGRKNEYQFQTTTFLPASCSIKVKEGQSQEFGQIPHSYQDFEESHDGDKSEESQTPLQDFEEIETDEDKILNPKVSTTSTRRSGIRYEGLLIKNPMKDF
ncbi:hypothetical protein PPACK8108_LOCUS21913 [Phakopsora pachyrhizi]|uniref:Uncharacterized protein n=1 Tax=Phakopsora pachyrhizi TaxID=170000 RepID=A0AAV0BIN4_PHAPC|nr:hypothetical protein PPACK8108_LOCUS21913 [Phakopsora pachyrhizi]